MSEGLKRLLGVVLVMSVGLYITSLVNHSLFHFSTEIITVFIGVMIFIMAINSKVYSERIIFLAMGIAYLYIGVLDIIHIITSDSMLIIASASPSISRTFFMSARLIESANILIIFYLYRKEHKTRSVLEHITHILAVGIVIAVAFSGTVELIPDDIVVGINFALVIAMLVFLLTGLFYSRQGKLEKESKVVLTISVVLKFFAVLLYVISNGEENTITAFALIFKFISYFGFYYVFVERTLNQPYENVSKVFKDREEEIMEKLEKDSLTGIFNHSTTYEKLENLLEKYKGKNKSFFVTLIDIDDFKQVNDKYGHQMGDSVLKEFSDLLLASNYEDKVVGRYGGDEFIIAGKYDKRIDSYERFVLFNKRLAEINKKLDVNITFSAGTAVYNIGDQTKDLVYKADIKMYESKRLGKNRVSIWK